MADASVAAITPSMTYKELKDALLRAGVSSEELFGAADKLALLEVVKRHGLNNSAVPADTVVASEAASASLSSTVLMWMHKRKYPAVAHKKRAIDQKYYNEAMELKAREDARLAQEKAEEDRRREQEAKVEAGSLAMNARTANATTTASAAAQRRLESSRNRVPEQRLKLSAAAAVVDVVSPPKEIATPPTDSASTADTRRAGALAIGGHALFEKPPSLEYESAEAQPQVAQAGATALNADKVAPGDPPLIKLEDELTPFDGKVKLNATFKDLHENRPGCVIPETELRAATVLQLEAVAKHIKRRCEAEGWADSRDSSVILTANTVNLYAANDYVIRPATEGRKCSYIELVAVCAQPPKWFCSHWWGEPVLNFVDCIVTHALDHGYSLEICKHYDPMVGYWVCAYANNQWDLTSVVNAPTLEETSFYKALKLAEGAISILDKGGMCFKRVWCSYECYVVFKKLKGLKYEVYTAKEHDFKDWKYKSHPRSAIGIIDGLGIREEKGKAEDIEDKALRFRHFPIELLKQAFQVTLETAQASKEADRVKILNTIAEQADLAAEPPETHELYDALNAILRGRFAIVALPLLLAAGESIEQAAKVLKGCGQRKLELSFTGLMNFDANAMQLIAQNLPPELEELVMKQGGLAVSHMQPLADALRVHASVTECNLRDNGLGVEGWTIIFNALRDSPMSKIITWDLSDEKLGPGIAKPLADYISVTPSLTSLNLSGNNLGQKGAAVLALAIAVCASVTKVLVSFNRLGDGGATILCDALRESTVTKVQVQELDLRGNDIGPDGAKAVAAMAAVVASLTSLNLSNNELCGVKYGRGTYTADGIKAIADALRVSASLTLLDVRYNSLDEEGEAVLRKAVESCSGLKLEL